MRDGRLADFQCVRRAARGRSELMRDWVVRKTIEAMNGHRSCDSILDIKVSELMRDRVVRKTIEAMNGHRSCDSILDIKVTEANEIIERLRSVTYVVARVAR